MAIRLSPRAARLIGCFAACVVAGVGVEASAQQLSFRIATAPAAFTPLHSYAHGEDNGFLVFFGGISGMGLHNVGEGNGVVSFPFNTFNRTIYVFEEATGQLYSGGIAHLPSSIREALTVTNPASVQYGATLYVYGGYGPTLAEDNFFTRSTVMSIDLAQVWPAVRTGQPVPAGAFTLTETTAAQVAGARIVKLGQRFCLIGGSNFTGDYGRAVTATFSNVYPNKVQVFDSASSFNAPAQTFFTSSSSTDKLRRRDMNALPATLPPAAGGAQRYAGFVVTGGVFKQGAFVWDTPLKFAYGDADVTHVTTFTQNMNQYEGPVVSFYSAAADQNRFVLFSGISSSVYNGSTFTNVFPQVPWSTEITQITMNAGVFDSETVIGAMPLPTVDADVMLNPLMPVNSVGQVNFDAMPANEVLLGRVYGGLRAASATNTPPTFASNTILEIYVVKGVRGDISGDGVVGASDLAQLLGAWGTSNTIADMNLDGVVNAADLAQVLGLWGNSTPG